MGFVGHDDNVVIGNDGRQLRLIEFLDERKNKTGVALEFLHQIRAAGSDELRRFDSSEHTAVFKGVADLGIEFIAIGQDDKSWRTGSFAADLLSKKEHGITFTAALSMPEYTEFAIFEFAV